MRKLLLFAFLAYIGMHSVFSQTDIVLADYEASSIYPNRTGAWNYSNLTLGVTNPIKDATNGSDKVAKLHITSQWSDAVVIGNFTEPISLGTHPFIKVKVLSDSAVSKVVSVSVKDIYNYEQTVQVTLPANVNTAWTNAVFDFSSIVQNTPISFIDTVIVKFDYGTATNANNAHNIYYFDDIRFTGPSLTVTSSDELTLFSEIFHDNGWWGTGGGTPMNDLISYFRSAAWGGSALSAAEKYYTVTDSFSMAMDGWSGQTNGYFYPAASRAPLSKLTLKEIGISGTQNLKVEYDLKWKTAPTSFTSAPTIEYSLNGTSWTAVTTSSTLPTANDTWATGITHNLTGVTGNTLMVRITNNTDGYFMLDNIKVVGNPALVTSVDVETQDATNAIDVKGAAKQMVASVLPAAANQNVLWTMFNGTGKATLSASGELTAVKNGSVFVIGRALDLYGTVRDTQEVTLTNQVYPVTSITIVGADSIKTNDGQANYTFNLTPTDADTLTYTVSLVDSSDNVISNIATFNNGTLTALRNGYVIIKAVADDHMHVVGKKTVVMVNQVVEVQSVAITSANTISTNGGTLTLTASVTPADAVNTAVTWSITSNDADTASLTGNVLKAIRNGKVTVKATSVADNTKFAEQEITISNQVVAVQSIAINGSDITTNAGTSQMSVTPTPADAQGLNIKWSLSSAADSAKATISAFGLVEAFCNGSITVNAKELNSGVTATKTINISGQIQVSSITVSGTGGATSINTPAGQLQMIADILPANARVKTVKWSIVRNGGNATISQTGLVTATKDGHVWVKATALDGSNVFGQFDLTITGQVDVTSVDILVASDTIKMNDGTLTLPVSVLPANASDRSVTWTIESMDADTASIDSVSGVIKALRNGKITVRATSNSIPTIYDEATVVITNQVIEPKLISIIGTDSISTIDENDGTLQLLVSFTPADAVKDIVWSIAESDADTASISTNGLVTAIRDGVVFVQASSTVAAVAGTFEITITNQIVEPTAITVKGENDSTSISVINGTLQMLASFEPLDANTNVTWSLAEGGADLTTISETGLLTAKKDGIVTVIATSNVANGVSGQAEITISNQAILVTEILVTSPDSITTIDVAGGTLQLTAVVHPEEATNKVVAWSVNNSGVASVDQAGLVTAINDGSVTVTATATDGSNVSGSITLTVSKQNIVWKEIDVTKVVDGKQITGASDFTVNGKMAWDSTSFLLHFDVTDDSIYAPDYSYNNDNFEIYFDMTNGKAPAWPRGQAIWPTSYNNLPGYYQLRLIPGLAFDSVNTWATGFAKQQYQVTETGYTFDVAFIIDSLSKGYVPEVGKEIGFDVLASDNDNNPFYRDQLSYHSPLGTIWCDAAMWTTFAFAENGGFTEVVDDIKPSVVSNLATTKDYKKVLLTWDPATDNIVVDKYVIFIDDVEDTTIYAKLTDNAYFVKNIEPDVKYTFSIVAEDIEGNRSDKVSIDYTDVSVNDNHENSLVLYPNPASAYISLNNKNSIELEVINTTGQLVIRKSLNAGDKLDISSLSHGLYTVRAIEGDKISVLKFIKQ